ncbi:MAG: hypothetical protein ACJ763_00635 [Bdellovibrionia bacterium]
MKYLNLMMVLAVSLLIHATHSFADENKAAPFICVLKAFGDAPIFGVDPLPIQRFESKAMSTSGTAQEWFFNFNDQYFALVMMYAQNTSFTATLAADATETRPLVRSTIRLPRLNGSTSIDLDVPNGLKGNPYVQRLRLTCYDSETSAVLKAKGYLEFKEKNY